MSACVVCGGEICEAVRVGGTGGVVVGVRWLCGPLGQEPPVCAQRDMRATPAA